MINKLGIKLLSVSVLGTKRGKYLPFGICPFLRIVP